MGNEALKNGGKSASCGHSWGMVHECAPVDDTDIKVVGLLAFSALAAVTRLTKDGDQAPDIKVHTEHVRVSARAFKLFEQLKTRVGHRGCDLREATGQYSGFYDDPDAGMRPNTWSERSVKTCVTLGIAGDLLRGVSERHSLFDTNPDVWGPDQEDWERDHLASQIGEDSQLMARPSLWARRVAGEIFSLARATLFTHPVLAKEPGAVDGVAALVTKRHNERTA